jgi:hypothetical protein
VKKQPAPPKLRKGQHPPYSPRYPFGLFNMLEMVSPKMAKPKTGGK